MLARAMRMQFLSVQFLPVVTASIFSLHDASRPLLSNEDQTLTWWEGGPAFALASMGAIRINFRGVYTYSATSVLRDLKALGWNKVTCNVSAWAMCASDAGQAFPSRNPRLPENIEAVTSEGWDTLACANNRHKVLVSLGVYDISACDVLDEGLDVVYARGELYHRHKTLDVWEYWIFVALSIVLVRFFSYNIQVLWEPPGAARPVKPQRQAMICCMIVIAVVVLDRDSHFVTSGDQVFFWSNVLYVLFYLGLHFERFVVQKEDESHDSKKEKHDDARIRKATTVPVYNIIIGTLQLVACRFYASAETPYNLVLMGILATRAWCKLLQSTLAPSILLDSLFLSLCIELAFNGTRELLVAVLGIAYLGGLLLSQKQHV